ncbi:uncharacterized protein [Amphiura filiformis]|uniref:uncharacterized protein n=1 Tax=Amphiura filiformis TaxID=82378 RepID=UPI003B223011
MRKIKSKRKKKVSTIDPFCNIASRRQMVVTKENQLNQAPQDPDEQPMTRKLQDLIKIMDPLKHKGAKKKKVKRLEKDSSAIETMSKKARKRKRKQDAQKQEQQETNVKLSAKEEAEKDKVRRYRGESEKKFVRRVRSEADKEIRDQMDQIKLLGKHQADVLDEPGEKKVSNRDKERLQKLKEKKKKKQVEKKIDKLEDQYFKDKVEFGEVAARPPELSFQPRKGQPSNTAGQRKLLLTSLMEKTPSQSSQAAAKCSVQKKKQVHKFKKRKDMDNAEKRRFDSIRQEAILAYRQAKAVSMAQRTLNP